ncbi:MAG: SurA N-terminal domain-containing protein [SAR202 cluster bacterium]|nr:SurA N-terminal domain-containing protein [SAR202 cluster bacterium]
MPFPWLRRFGSAETGRAERRRSMRAQRRAHGEDDTPQEDTKVLAERRQFRVGVGIGAAFLLIIVGVVAFGYYQSFYKPPRVWAGSVNNVEFKMGDLVQRIRVLQGVNRYQGGQVNLSTIPFEYLQNLIHAEVLRQQSPLLGIEITDEDIENDLRRQFTPTPEPGQETDPGQLEQEFKANYTAFLTATGLSDGEFRVIIEEQISVRALAALLSRDIEDPQQQVEIQWIQLSLDGNISPDDVVRRLENEDFVRVAQELNTAGQFSGTNGYVGWVPKGAFPNLDDTLFGNEEKGKEPLAVGAVSEPIFTAESNFIVKILSGAEERELEDRMALQLTVELVKQWQKESLTSGTSQGNVKMNFNSKLYEWVTDQVFITAPRVER